MVDSDRRERAKAFVMAHGLNPDFIVSIVAHFAEREVALVEAKYHELLLEVEDKQPGETRHQSALRIIRQGQRKLTDSMQGGVNHGTGK
jgi:hypothetical protein